MDHAENYLVLAAGKITCRRCLGTSRRTQKQCGAPAEKHSSKCRFHGARATGPVTMEGLARCAAARTIHGNETRFKRKRAQLQSQLIRSLKALSAFLDSNPTDTQLTTSPLVALVFEQIFQLREYDATKGPGTFDSIFTGPHDPRKF